MALDPKFIQTVVNTRFNPTVNGPLHLGHLYLCLVNEYEAHRTGGMFSVRFDDSKPCTVRDFANWDLTLIPPVRKQQLADIEMFCTVDYSWSETENKWRLAQLPPLLIEDWKYMDSPLMYPEMAQYRDNTVPSGSGEQYPYVPGWTAEKVFFDMMTGINWLIRGDDLLSEFSLYQYFNEMLGAPLVRHTYMPRLQPKSGRLDTVSKTTGGYSICATVARYGKEETLEILRDSCLVDRDGPFSVANIKPEPVLTI